MTWEKEDKEIFYNQMEQLCIIYNRRQDDLKSLCGAYKLVLEKYTMEHVKRACDEIIKNEKFFPVPAVIIEYCEKYESVERNDRKNSDILNNREVGKKDAISIFDNLIQHYSEKNMKIPEFLRTYASKKGRRIK